MAGRTQGRRKRRKKGKYTPLMWVVIAVLLAVSLYLSGYISSSHIVPGFNIKAPETNRVISQTNSSVQAASLITQAAPVTAQAQVPAQLSNINNKNINVKIYLARQSGQKAVLFEKDILVEKSQSLLKTTLDALISNRDQDSLNLIPINTRIKRVWIKDNIAYIDFSNEFSYNSYGVIGYKIQIYQIVYTATQFENISAVYFYMDGKPLNYLGGDGYGINNPVYPFTSIPEFSL